MNINLEFTVKVKASDDTSKPSGIGLMLGQIVQKVAAHPCVMMIVRELTKRS